MWLHPFRTVTLRDIYLSQLIIYSTWTSPGNPPSHPHPHAQPPDGWCPERDRWVTRHCTNWAACVKHTTSSPRPGHQSKPSGSSIITSTPPPPPLPLPPSMYQTSLSLRDISRLGWVFPSVWNLVSRREEEFRPNKHLLQNSSNGTFWKYGTIYRNIYFVFGKLNTPPTGMSLYVQT